MLSFPGVWPSERCGHQLPGEPKSQFLVMIFDVVHGSDKPLKAHIWDCASTLLESTPLSFRPI